MHNKNKGFCSQKRKEPNSCSKYVPLPYKRKGIFSGSPAIQKPEAFERYSDSYNRIEQAEKHLTNAQLEGIMDGCQDTLAKRGTYVLFGTEEIKPAKKTRPPVELSNIEIPDDAAGRLLEMAIERAGSNGRNAAGYWLACQLRDHGFHLGQALTTGRGYADAVTGMKRDAYPFSEFKSTCRRAYNQPAREPFLVTRKGRGS